MPPMAIDLRLCEAADIIRADLALRASLPDLGLEWAAVGGLSTWSWAMSCKILLVSSVLFEKQSFGGFFKVHIEAISFENLT